MLEEFKPQYTFTEDRLNELKQLFPEAFEDGLFNVDTLKELIGKHSTSNKLKEHFGLNWVGKQDARKIASIPPTGTLKPCPGEGVNEVNTENIFIEGENLEVLKILRKSYMGKIKMIYIDPPYNTGNDFIYNDTFADSTEDYLRKTGEKSDEGLLVSNPKSSGKYHANWLSFMYPRLRLAKDLLKEDGVIFISIDDNEVDNLRLLCSEIFGEENFISNIIWEKRYGRSNNAKLMTSSTEHILFYRKSEKLSILRELRSDDNKKGYSNQDNDPRGDWTSVSFVNQVTREARPNLSYTIQNPNTLEKIDHPTNAWKVSKEKYEFLLKDNRLHWGNKGDSKYPRIKRFWSELDDGMVPVNLWKYSEAGTAEMGTKEVKELMNFNAFSFPKPTLLIQKMLTLFNPDISDNKSGIVLDFFAGSGTTAQAVLDLNKKDGGNRKFICVQIPEDSDVNSEAKKNGYNKISDLTKERIKRAVNTIDKDQGFKIYTQNKSNFNKWQEFVPDQDGALPDLFNNLELAYKNPLQDGVTTQDFITEVILQEGFPLTSKQEEVVSGIFRITHEWVPYTLYATMLHSFKDIDFSKLKLQDTDHLVCLDKAFEGNDALKQELDNQCKIFTI